MREEFKKILEEYRSLGLRLEDPEFLKKGQENVTASKRFAELQELGSCLTKYHDFERRLDEAVAMAKQESDPELKIMVQQETDELSKTLENYEQESSRLYAVFQEPKEADQTHKEMILEVRAGTGGDEAALFARDLFSMYERYALNHSWDITLIHENKDELGGYKEIVAEVRGKGAYDVFQHEQGVHRVQRIPETEKSGRIHTSTATVAVLPVVKDVNIEVQDKDLEIEFIRSSGPGGQNVNKLSTAVRMKHIATGVTVFCQSQRHQHQNREKALEILKSKLYQRELEERQQKATAARRAQVGTGERSEKIRTYNFPQDRVTDHRINQSWKNMSRIMNGDLDIIWAALRAAPPS